MTTFNRRYALALFGAATVAGCAPAVQTAALGDDPFEGGIGGTGVAYSLAGVLNRRVGAVRMSIVTYMIPLVAIVLGVLFRDETVTGWAVIGTGVVLLGAFLSSRVD